MSKIYSRCYIKYKLLINNEFTSNWLRDLFLCLLIKNNFIKIKQGVNIKVSAGIHYNGKECYVRILKCQSYEFSKEI